MWSSQVAAKKTFCQDLTEGKFSFPIIHAIQSGHPESSKVLDIVKQRTENVDLSATVFHCWRKSAHSPTQKKNWTS